MEHQMTFHGGAGQVGRCSLTEVRDAHGNRVIICTQLQPGPSIHMFAEDIATTVLADEPHLTTVFWIEHIPPTVSGTPWLRVVQFTHGDERLQETSDYWIVPAKLSTWVGQEVVTRLIPDPSGYVVSTRG
jgi:hypothetical protein